MFDFFKKKKIDNDDEVYVENVSSICTLNKYQGMHCNVKATKEKISIEYEDGSMNISYSEIVDCGIITNSELGIKEAMKEKILTPEVMQSPGFISGNFYVFSNNASEFLYIKFIELGKSKQTLLISYNKGINKVLKYIRNQLKNIK